jgi:hypothetical protein
MSICTTFSTCGRTAGGSTKPAGRSSSCVTPTMWWRDLSMKERPSAFWRTSAADCKVCAIAAPGQDATDRDWPLCGRASSRARLGQTGGVQLSWFHAYQRADPKGTLSPDTQEPPRSNAGQAQSHQGRIPTTHARPHPATGAVAAASGARLLCIPRRANQPPQSGGLSVLRGGASG